MYIGSERILPLFKSWRSIIFMESELDPRKMFRSCIIVTKSQGLIKHRYLLEQLLFLEIMFFDKDVGFHWKKRILLSIMKIFRAF